MSAVVLLNSVQVNERQWPERLELELGIVGLQKPLWDIFIETIEALSVEQPPAGVEADSPTSELVPSLPDLLRRQHGRLAIERMGVRNLIESLDLLYRSLTPRQRGRADRMLRPFFIRIGLGPCVGVPILPLSVSIRQTIPLPPKVCRPEPRSSPRRGAPPIARVNECSRCPRNAEMSKSAHEKLEGEASLPFVPAIDASMLVGARRAMLDASRAFGDMWSRSARDFMAETTELTTRLSASKSPADVPAAYGRWMEAQFKRAAADSQEVMEIWQDAVKTSLANGGANGSGAGNRHR